MTVLAIDNRILAGFAPIIMNIAGSKCNNLTVAEYLESKGYQLSYYQPYLQKLISLDSNQNLQGQLNIIAYPNSKISDD